MTNTNAEKFDNLIKTHKRRDEPALVTAPAEERQAREIPSPVAAQEQRGRGRPAVGKRNSSDYQQITAFIRKATRRDVDIALAKRDYNKELSDALEEALTLWLQKEV